MTDQLPDRRSGRDRRVTGMNTAATGWLSEEVRMTRGFLLSVVAVAMCFIGFSAWGAVSTVNSLRKDDCIAANDRRTDLREVAHDLVDNDRFLVELADELASDGLPPEFVNPLDQRYTEQDTKIDAALSNTSCP